MLACCIRDVFDVRNTCTHSTALMLVSRLVYVRWALQYSLHDWLDQTLEVGVPLHKLEVETVPLHHNPRHLHPKNIEEGRKRGKGREGGEGEEQGGERREGEGRRGERRSGGGRKQ